MKYINYSGGCPGADMVWETLGYDFGVETIAMSFSGHVQYGKNPRILTQDELDEGFSHCQLAEKTINRPLDVISKIPYVKNLISRNWFQVKNADAVYAIGSFVPKNNLLVNGGTGWAVQMAIDAGKTVWFFNQSQSRWYLYDPTYDMFLPNITPILTEKFAGIGTRDIIDCGMEAIHAVYSKTFPSTI